MSTRPLLNWNDADECDHGWEAASSIWYDEDDWMKFTITMRNRRFWLSGSSELVPEPIPFDTLGHAKEKAERINAEMLEACKRDYGKGGEG